MAQRETYDIAIIGAGPAGLAAAISAREAGAENILIIERDTHPGGILQQCIHPGFGLEYFGEELTGPEYAYRFCRKAADYNINIMLDTMVLSLEKGCICAVSPQKGLFKVNAKAIVLAMGCRERTRGAIKIPGTRAAGIYTAGAAQRMLNIKGELVGRKIVILGSGDIGMIMARRMTLEGAEVKVIVEILPYLSGLIRNKVQCLDDFGIPLRLAHTITDISGVNRVESVTICEVDDNKMPVRGSEEIIECDTVLLSVGLIPENEISMDAGIKLSAATKGPVVDQFMQTSIKGVFACGNVLHVNDLVDNVTRESEIAGRSAALYAAGKLPEMKHINTAAGRGVGYVCPQLIACAENEAELFFRVRLPMNKVTMSVLCGPKVITSRRAARVSPGEMDKLVLSKEMMRAVDGDITICVEEEQE
ncbi:FAD-binding protein [Enterocloster aldenensis]|uniref:NAD(P)/FAD-dependent oxidoreductase n=1 Tax=Enterocloster aldenensis TaxID=358742 RepID=UPI000E53F94D|nr:FAD-binding protein [Enterocloster aldenensis]